MSLGASRKQFLSDNTVNLQLPNLSLNFSPHHAVRALPGEESWYSNSSWQGRLRRAHGSRSALSVGRLSWSQTLSVTEQELFERQLPGDTLPPVPGRFEQRGQWTSGFNFQQRLMGTSTFTPGVSLGGEFIRNDLTDRSTVHAPMRVDFNAALRTDLFGFWPGAGPFEAVRHRLSPTISYNYSPEARADSLQREVFTRAGVVEQNRISIGISQTWEAKYRGVQADPDTSLAGTPTDTAGVTPAEEPAAGEPRRRQQTQTVTLLSVSTDALVYDFVEARDGYGLRTTQISNSVHSDLLRGLQLNFTHDLFRQDPTGEDGVVPGRTFAPHLSRVNASFQLSGNSWLFRILRLGSQDTLPARGPSAPLDEGDPSEGGPAVDRSQSETGLIGSSRRFATSGPRGPVGSWNASFNYTLARPRAVDLGDRGNQMLTGNFMFQPTENWAVRWNTGYSFTSSEFTDHVLTLTRSLHDWDASFDFIKAQNGNFSFQFRVHLRANPDIKLDYSQSDMQGVQRLRQQ
jgi:hypothetical protein